MRDALVAATTLDIFNRHADKVVMGAIAQTINVLQAMILTDGPRMLTTPTYHVYDMYQQHQGGTSLQTRFDTADIQTEISGETISIPALSGSASLKERTLTLSVVNSHADSAIEAAIQLNGAAVKSATVTTLAGDDIHAHNTFDAADRVTPQAAPAEISGDHWSHAFPPASVTVLTLTL